MLSIPGQKDASFNYKYCYPEKLISNKNTIQNLLVLDPRNIKPHKIVVVT